MTQSIPDTIDLNEPIGRAVFDSKHANHARKNAVPPKVFQEKLGVLELSVDRLSHVSLQTAADVQTSLRGRDCRGWAVIVASVACDNGRTINSDPIAPHQLHHAFIRLPECPEEELFNEQKKHAVELAMKARWQEAPSQ